MNKWISIAANIDLNPANLFKGQIIEAQRSGASNGSFVL